jgi:hypothetical protein
MSVEKFHPLLIATGSLALVACATTIPKGTIAQREADSPCPQSLTIEMNPTDSFEIRSCTRLGSGEFDKTVHLVPPVSCELPGVEVREVRRRSRVDSDFRLRSKSGIKDVAFTPDSGFEPKGVGHPAPLACDPEAKRFFVANVYVGTVAAFSHEGRELWGAQLPNFRSIVGDPTVLAGGAVGMIQAVNDWGSLASYAVVSGPYVAFQHMTGVRHVIHTVFHRSGWLVGTLGPWDGMLLGAVPGGFQFASGGVETYGDLLLPTRKISVIVSNDRAELAVAHFLAWTLPESPQSPWRWRVCALLAPSAIHWRLKDRFDPKLADETKRIHDQLGFDWANELLARGEISEIGSLDPTTPDRDERLQRELIVVGVDVDLVKAMKHQQDSSSQSRSPQ